MDRYARANRAVDRFASVSQTKQTSGPEDREQSDYGRPQTGRYNQKNGQDGKFAHNRKRKTTIIHDER